MVLRPQSAQSQSRSGAFSPAPLAQSLQTGRLNHSPHPSQVGHLSAGGSPGTSSPIAGSGNLTSVYLTQFSIRLAALGNKTKPALWDEEIEKISKLMNGNGMDVFTKSFTKLVTQNAAVIFGSGRPDADSAGSYAVLKNEMAQISHDLSKGPKIAEAIQTATEDLFRDFDLSTFMEHFKLDALEKTILALGFKEGPRSDLTAKADAILSINFPTFVNVLSRPDIAEHMDLSSSDIATIIDRYIQGHPPQFPPASKSELAHRVKSRWPQDQAPPMEVLAAFDLVRVLADKPPNALTLYVREIGAEFTSTEEDCEKYLRKRPANINLSEEQVSSALTYTTISRTPRFDPSVLVAALRRVLPASFSWENVVSYFDQRDVRVSSEQFLRLYNALLPIAQVRAQVPDLPAFDIQRLWGGPQWENPETQLAFICSFASLTPNELDASTIPGLEPTFTLEEYQQAPDDIQQRAAFAVRHPLVSAAALSAIFQVALHSLHASQSIEAKRLFQEVVVPNLDIFIVSAFGVPKPWPLMAVDTLVSLFDNFLHKLQPHDAFVMYSLWSKDRDWVRQRLIDAHAVKPLDLPIIFEHVIKQGWLDDLVYLPSGFGYDLAALAHAEGYLDLSQWAQHYADRRPEVARSLAQFLMIKANMELQFQRPADGQTPQKSSTTLQVRTVHALLQILEDFMPTAPVQELIMAQRHCIIAYPRLINYGEGYDDIIDANGATGNALPVQADARMQEHYKTMYSNEAQVKDIVEVLARYKHSREPLDQDVFACMIHGLFDEYSHYHEYPLEALATSAVLFGGIIGHKLISDLPLKIALGMILEAVRDHRPDDNMYKFGLQALMQLFSRFREWPGFCKQLTQIPGLQGTEAARRAAEVVREHDEEMSNGQNGISGPGSESMVNGNGAEDAGGPEAPAPPFASINVEPSPAGIEFEDPPVNVQDDIQFGLNNLTTAKLLTTFDKIHSALEERHQQWFATHLVEERAKMQPNYHQVYLELVKLFQDRALSAEVLRQTYISAARLLNSENTMQSSIERTHLKHLGAWLGLLTLARDQPIKHRNIAFKQLLIEAHDTKRLVVVIPFVCSVLVQGAKSTVYRPPNPWLMDILHLLIELYHNAEMKLQLKFEIMILCKELNLDYKSIEPSQELLNRSPVDDLGDLGVQDALESFDNLSMNGMGGAMATTVSAGLSPHTMPPSIPDLGPQLQIPPTNEMVVSAARLHEIVRTALTRALSDIIQPVVDRSVTIAAISTAQMIHKDFATEPDEARLRNAAITMVKATAGSLALVTSKEPLRANITNYMRNLSSDLPQGLPEGTILMCVNSNLDLACDIIEKHAKERAVPEIEEMLEGEMEARRRHRAQRPNEPYVDPSLSRWAMTIPNPYKLSPSMSGLNPEQLAIYEDFARQPRAAASAGGQAHSASASDATRNIANEVLQDQYSSVPSIPTPAETPSLPHLQSQLPYPHGHQGLTNGRPSTHPSQVDARGLAERMQKFLGELQRAATESQEQHFNELPRPHPVLDAVDALTQFIIRTSQGSEEFAFFAAEKICQLLFGQIEHSLFLESLVHTLQMLLKIAASSGIALNERVQEIFVQQPPASWLNLPLITALLPTELLQNYSLIDDAMSKALAAKQEGSLDFFERLLDLMLFNDRPRALFSDLLGSLRVAWDWIRTDPDLPVGQRLKSKLDGSGLPTPQIPGVEDPMAHVQDHHRYLLREWLGILTSYNRKQDDHIKFVQQLPSRGRISNKDDFLSFLRTAVEASVASFEQTVYAGGGSAKEGFAAIDGLVTLITTFTKEYYEEPKEAVGMLFASANLVTMVLNQHHVTRGERFNQRVFFRFYSMLLYQLDDVLGPDAAGSAAGLDGAEACRKDFIFKLAGLFLQLGPARFPGFGYSWLNLIMHRKFLPVLMGLEGKRGWLPFTKLLVALLRYVSEHIKVIDMADIAKDYVRATIKILLVLQHDYPEYIAENHMQLCDNLPPHAVQMRNIILFAAAPRQETAEPQETTAVANDYDRAVTYLRENNLLDLLDQLLQNGPSEDAIAHLTHSISKNLFGKTVYGNVPLTTNTALVNAVVSYVGTYAVGNPSRQDATLFTPKGADFSTLSLLAHELGPESRYFLLSCMVDELRNPNSRFTTYFSSVLLELWGHDINDPEEVDIRQQLVRIILERFSGFWPQTWGLTLMILELTKNDKYMFFEQPFIKADREVGERFHAMYRAAAESA